MGLEPFHRVLVTGASGFVGSHVAEHLTSMGARVRCLVRHSSSLRYLPVGAEILYGELATGEGLDAAVADVDVVLHVAGVTKASSEAAYYRGNVNGTRNLLAACERAAVRPRRFIHVSSLAAVGPSPNGAPLQEDAAALPLTWYGCSKLASEQVVRNSAMAASAVILRPAVVFGPRDTDVFEVFRSAAHGFMLLIGQGESWFSYIHVRDLAAAIVAAASHPRAAGGTYFIANPEPVSWTAFTRAAAGHMGRNVRFLRVPAAAAYGAGWCAEIAAWLRRRPSILSRQKIIEARCRYWTCDTSRAVRELEFQAGQTLEQGIADTLAWYKEAGWLAW